MVRIAARISRMLTVALATALGPAGASAEDAATNGDAGASAPAAAVERLFGDEPPRPGWFSESFLAAVPSARVAAIVNGIVADFGAFVGVRMNDGEGTVLFERAVVPVTVSLDAEGRIAGLMFGPPVPTGGDPAAVAALVEDAATGEVAILATVDGTPLVARDADRPMAVGSAFKLFVLSAYEAAVAEGRLRRDAVVELTEADRSLPSGVLQTLAPGTPVTLELLAGLMIQHSDNTATDALMRVLGRDAIDAALPRGAPVPTTSELFKLKAAGEAARRRAYAEGDEATRRAILEGLADEPLPTAARIEATASWRDVEWFVTARELCEVLLRLRDAPALGGAPNPLVAREGWPWVGFKGGSELGVLNLGAAGVSPSGRTACAVVTANGDDAQPEERIALLFSALFRSLDDAAR